MFLFGGCFAVLPPSHEGRVVYVTQAGQGVMINYGSAPHISPLRSLRLTLSDYTLLLFVFNLFGGSSLTINQMGSSHLVPLISTVRNPYNIVSPRHGHHVDGRHKALGEPIKVESSTDWVQRPEPRIMKVCRSLYIMPCTSHGHHQWGGNV